MRTPSIVTAAAVLALAAMQAGCAAVTAKPESAPLAGTAWTLSALPGRELLPSTVPTLAFEAERVAGTDGCNRYMGTYAASGGTLTFSRLASTMMACPPPVAEQARAYSDALTGTRSYRVADGRLELLDATGAVRAAFAAQSRELAGTSWRVLAVNNGKGGVVSVATGTELTLEFGTDGRAGGSAGCNRYTAGYTFDGAALTFTAPGATRRMCAEPAGVMAQEQDFLRALGTVVRAHQEGDRLELRTRDGALAVQLARARH